jgi:hypothetical protein
VHDALAVAVVERGQDVGGDLQCPLRQDLVLLVQHVTQGSAFDVLHDDVGDGSSVAVEVLAGVVHRDDRRMVQFRRGLRLSAKPRLEGAVAG